MEGVGRSARSPSSALVAWLVAIALVLGVIATARTPAAAVATVLLRASEPSDIAPSEPNEPDALLDRHARRPDVRAEPRGASPESRPISPTRAALEDRVLRVAAIEPVAAGRTDPDAALESHHSRARLRLMVFLN